MDAWLNLDFYLIVQRCLPLKAFEQTNDMKRCQKINFQRVVSGMLKNRLCLIVLVRYMWQVIEEFKLNL